MYRCLSCKDISYKPLQPLTERFSNTYRLSNNENKKFILLLRKGSYPYEYIDDWNRFNETELPSNVWNTFNIKNLGEYHDLYVQSDTLLLADVF